MAASGDERELPVRIVSETRSTSSADVAWLEDLDRGDVSRAGGKGANLGELTRIDVPVPPGFVVCTSAFDRFLAEWGSDVEGVLDALAVDDHGRLLEVSAELQQRVRAAGVPEATSLELEAMYDELGRRTGVDAPYVAVRSSATVEDMPESSFAGMNESILNVRGHEALRDALVQCWASLYGARVIFYRRKLGIPESRVSIAVVVQAMVESTSAGVMFTVDPTRPRDQTLVIEGAFGFGDVVVGGSVSPDHWLVDKTTLEIREEQIAVKTVRTERSAAGRHETVSLEENEGGAPCLTSDQVREIAELGNRIERHYGSAQDIEWALQGDRLFIVQSRPLTGLAKTGAEAAGDDAARGTSSSDDTTAEAAIRVRGLAAAPGIGRGTVRVLGSLQDGGDFEVGSVLVTRKTEPDWTPLMKKAAAIVTDEGGMTAHAAIVSRELGIPCVVGTREASQVLRDGELVTVDGGRGLVFEGDVAVATGRASVDATTESAAGAPVTATRLLVNLGQPERVDEVAARPVDGVGLLRLEFMFLSVTENRHPRCWLEEGRGEELEQRLAEQIEAFARAFTPRPVVVRTSDFRSNEYRHMEGGERFEPEEANPMIGYRGAFRYVKEPDLFRVEIGALRRVRDAGFDNLIVMLPFVRTSSELKFCIDAMREAGLDPVAEGPTHMPLWVMAEVPSILFRLEDFAAMGVSGVSIGSNDLTQLMLGCDRDSEVLAEVFDARDPAVLAAMRKIIETSGKLGLTCSICGQAPSTDPELTRMLVSWGIDSISVSADVIDVTRRSIARAERALLLEAARRDGANS